MIQASTKEYSSVRDAAERLQNALRTLETSLEPLVERVSELEQSAGESQIHDKERDRLTSELDQAATREARYKEREREVSELAQQTTQELDSVISQVLLALGED